MIVIVLPRNMKQLIDTDSITGVENYTPTETVRYRFEHAEHIKKALNLQDLSQYEMRLDEIVIENPQNIL